MNNDIHTIVWGNYRERELHTYSITGTQEQVLECARVICYQAFDIVYVTGLDKLGNPYYINVLK